MKYPLLSFIALFEFLLVLISCSSVSSSGGGSTDTSFSVSTPINFTSILQLSANVTPTTISSVSDRNRIMIKYGSDFMSTNSSLAIVLNSANSTYSDVLSNLFYLVQEPSETCYRLEPELQSNYSVDFDSGNSQLILRNNWGIDRDANSAYLCFTPDVSGQTLTASKRFKFNVSTEVYELDGTFTSQEVEYDGAQSFFKLSSSASTVTYYESGINLSIPSDFNPDGMAIASNDRVAWDSTTTETYSENNLSGTKIYMDTHSKYQEQVATAGLDDTTTAAASAMLDEIESTLSSAGASLRYNKAVYLAFRAALLNTKLAGANIVNGENGQNTAPYVFFTNESDDSGVPHPFMVIGTYSIAEKFNHLLDVPTPPGGTDEPSYADQDVTRDALLQTYLLKIPLKDYGEISTLTENTMDNTLADDVSVTTYTVYNYASVNYTGIAIDGLMLYPLLNNTLTSAHKKAEITSLGHHVGRGMGLHWHADGHGGNGNGLNLYNLRDYDGNSHPPLIGFGMDGVALFGRYESSYSDMDGYSEELDDYGGHEHGAYGYHYHAHSASSSVLGESPEFTLHILMKGAWKGKINDVPEFWGTASQMNRYVGTATEVP